jgi:hypothetical protein
VLTCFRLFATNLLLQIMLQPVVTPCGKTFEYAAVRHWITQHGTGGC